MAKKKQTNFETFKAECEKWIKLLEISGWNIYIKEEEITLDHHAETRTDLSSKTAAIVMNSVNPPENVEICAKHEVLHLLLARISELGQSRYVTEKEIIEAEEELVNVLHKHIK